MARHDTRGEEGNQTHIPGCVRSEYYCCAKNQTSFMVQQQHTATTVAGKYKVNMQENLGMCFGAYYRPLSLQEQKRKKPDW